MAGNHTLIKRYTDNYYSVMQLKGKKSDGVKIGDPEKEKKTNDKKLEESLARSRTNIFELAMCNDFDIFMTGTIDPKKYDRYNLKKYYGDFAKYINNLNNRHGLSIQYLLIPEKHKDGAWHIHGLLKGLPVTKLRKFNLKEKLPKYIRDKLKAGFDVYNWAGYASRFGFCDLEYIRNKEACFKYIVKYATKDLTRSVQELHARVYYCSRKLKRPEILFCGEMENIISLPDFENCYVMKKDFFDLASAMDFKNVQFFDSFIKAGFDERTLEQYFGI